MGQISAGCGEEVQLPAHLARALVAGVDCQVIIERRDSSEDPALTVPSFEEDADVGNADHSKLYRIGDGYIVFEMIGDSVSETVALHKDHLSEYIDNIFVDNPKRIVKKSGTDIAWEDSIIP